MLKKIRVNCLPLKGFSEDVGIDSRAPCSQRKERHGEGDGVARSLIQLPQAKRKHPMERKMVV